MDEKNVVEQVVDVATPVLSPKKWTIKKVLLYIVTLYFIFLILKFVAKIIWKSLNWFRKYIHDLTDEKKIGEVILWTIFGVVLGVLLYQQILDGLNWIGYFWNEIIRPWIGL